MQNLRSQRLLGVDLVGIGVELAVSSGAFNPYQRDRCICFDLRRCNTWVSRSGLAYTPCQHVLAPKWHHGIARFDTACATSRRLRAAPTRGESVDCLTRRARDVSIVSSNETITDLATNDSPTVRDRRYGREPARQGRGSRNVGHFRLKETHPTHGIREMRTGIGALPADDRRAAPDPPPTRTGRVAGCPHCVWIRDPY